MMGKTTQLFIIVLSVLMLYTGCDGDGEADENSPPLGGGIPRHPCEICPCDYFAIPQTQACWTDNVNATVPVRWEVRLADPNARPRRADDCTLRAAHTPEIGLIMSASGKLPCIGCPTPTTTSCLIQTVNLSDRFAGCDITMDFDIQMFDLTADQVTGCRQCLVLYAMDLEEVVNLGGDPVSCPPPATLELSCSIVVADLGRCPPAPSLNTQPEPGEGYPSLRLLLKAIPTSCPDSDDKWY